MTAPSSPPTEIYRRKLRNRIIVLLKESKLFGAVFNSRISQLDPENVKFPVAMVYANDDSNNSSFQESTNDTIKEGNITLQIQIVNIVEDEDIDNWPDAVEHLEAGVLSFLQSKSNERQIDDCINRFTLGETGSTVDVEGEEPLASSHITYSVKYNEDIAFDASEDFNSIAYTMVDDDITIAAGEFEVRDDQKS